MDAPHKAHRAPASGRKRQKKDSKKSKIRENPKAFAMYRAKRAAKIAQRTADLQEKKFHVPLIDRTPIEPPPVIVSVMGPSGSGKSSLIKSLIRHYTKLNLNSTDGPLTVVSGGHRRLTFIECRNDLNAYIDCAKAADLIIMCIDASKGFEMETFEFLNILQSHGLPKVLGVLTHLDTFTSAERLKRTKKTLKHRFWTELYDGAKLFYLSGMLHGRYLPRDIMNLARFLSVMKFRPLIWRNTHGYLLADRMEDLTDPEQLRKEPLNDRKVALYGYIRGTGFQDGAHVHIPGVGDLKLHDISALPDPCPLPEKASKRRALNEKERRLYAPMIDLGGILYDKDAIYIDLKEPQVEPTQGLLMLKEMKEMESTVDQKLQQAKLEIFKGIECLDDRSDTDEALDNQSTDTCESSVEDFSSSDETIDDQDLFQRRPIEYREDDEEEATGLIEGACNMEILKQRFLRHEEEDSDKSEDDQHFNPSDFESSESSDAERTLQEDAKIASIRAQFEDEYKDPVDKEENLFYAAKKAFKEQLAVNAELEGATRAGVYARLIVSVTPEFVEFFDARNPVLVGGLETASLQFGFLKARVKKHRWHGQILKSNEPLIVSLGWRRFQSLPLYYMPAKSNNDRPRFLKYTPKHMHCSTVFYGPITAQNTGFCAFKSLSSQTTGFRVSLTGVVLESDQSIELVKKLKLTGEAIEIHKNTAFVKGMFASALEVAKFEGAALKTVSGIRGQIKKAITSGQFPDGSFRATFEDKILKSDIIFMRTWVPVVPKSYYNPVTNLLSLWNGMKLNAELRRERQIPVAQKPDSAYKLAQQQSDHDPSLMHLQRPLERQFNPLRIPRALQAALPYSSIPKVQSKSNAPYLNSRKALIHETSKDRHTYTMLQQLSTVNNNRMKKLKKKQQAKANDRKQKLDSLFKK